MFVKPCSPCFLRCFSVGASFKLLLWRVRKHLWKLSPCFLLVGEKTGLLFKCLWLVRKQNCYLNVCFVLQPLFCWLVRRLVCYLNVFTPHQFCLIFIGLCRFPYFVICIFVPSANPCFVCYLCLCHLPALVHLVSLICAAFQSLLEWLVRRCFHYS